MANVIDSLIVTLGLDPKDFTKGQKEAAKSLIGTEKQVKKSSGEMSKAITDAARKFAVAFLGFESAQGLVRMLASLNNMERALGFVAKNTGVSATDLRDWSRAAELAGGTGEGFLGTIGQITAEQNKFITEGQSGWIGPLRQLGVGLIDAQGKARPALDVFTDLVNKLKEMERLQGRPAAFNFAKSYLGIDPDTINFMLSGMGKINGLLADQRKGFRLTDKETDAAQATQNRFTRFKQKGQDFLTFLLAKLRPIIDKWMDKLEAFMSHIDMDKVAAGIDRLIEGLADVAELLGDVVQFLAPIFQWIGTKIGESAGWIGKTWDKLFPSKEEREQNHQAVKGYKANETLDKLHGIAENSAYSQLHGLNTGAAIVDSLGLNEKDALHYLSLLSNITGKSQEEKLTAEDYEKIGKIVRSLAIQEAQKASAASGASGAAAAATGAGAAPRATASAQRTASSVTSTTTIGKIEVHTTEQNAPGIVNDIGRELERRGLVVGAETGLA